MQRHLYIFHQTYDDKGFEGSGVVRNLSRGLNFFHSGGVGLENIENIGDVKT